MPSLLFYYCVLPLNRLFNCVNAIMGRHICADMLLTHYNWKSVAERERGSLARGGGEVGTPAFGLSRNIDGLEEGEEEEVEEVEEEVDGTGDKLRRSVAAGPMNAGYDNSFCRMYVLLHDLEGVFPLLTEASAAACPLSEHQIGE